MDDDVTVSLSFSGEPGEEVPETEAVSRFASAPLQPFNVQEGLLTIEAGSSRAQFGDTMAWLVPKLCFEAAGGVLRKGTADVSLFAYDTNIALRRDGDSIELTSTTMEQPILLPAAGLTEALLGAGERYLALVPELWPEDPEAIRLLPEFRAELEAVRSGADPVSE